VVLAQFSWVMEDKFNNLRESPIFQLIGV
jgi:hypothetical protein